MDKITYTYQRTQDDFFKHALWHRMLRTPHLIFLNFIMPVIALVTTPFLMQELDGFYLFLVAYLVLFPFISYLQIRYSVKRIFKNQQEAFDVTTFTYTEKGIQLSSDKGNLTLEWDRIFKVYIRKAYIYIYLDRTNAFLINKTALEEGIVAGIEEYFTEKVAYQKVKHTKF